MPKTAYKLIVGPDSSIHGSVADLQRGVDVHFQMHDFSTHPWFRVTCVKVSAFGTPELTWTAISNNSMRSIDVMDALTRQVEQMREGATC